MASPTAPVHVPARAPHPRSRRPRHSFVDEIAHLTLPEVRDRLERNGRVLNSTLMSASPTHPNSVGPVASTSSASPGARASPYPSHNGGEPDHVRDRLLQVREALLAREQELVMNNFGGLSLEEKEKLATSPLRKGSKGRALAVVRQREWEQRSSVALPLDYSLALSDRDYQNAAMKRFSEMELEPSRSTSGRGRDRNYDMARSSRYRGDVSNEDIFPTDEEFASAQIAAGDARDEGTGMPMATKEWARDTDGDEVGDDPEDQDFSEGNDEYRELEGGPQIPPGWAPEGFPNR